MRRHSFFGMCFLSKKMHSCTVVQYVNLPYLLNFVSHHKFAWKLIRLFCKNSSRHLFPCFKDLFKPSTGFRASNIDPLIKTESKKKQEKTTQVYQTTTQLLEISDFGVAKPSHWPRAIKRSPSSLLDVFGLSLFGRLHFRNPGADASKPFLLAKSGSF